MTHAETAGVSRRENVCFRGANESDDARWRAPNGDASPELVESGEVEWGAMPNLDLFFERVYRCTDSFHLRPMQRRCWCRVPAKAECYVCCSTASI